VGLIKRSIRSIKRLDWCIRLHILFNKNNTAVNDADAKPMTSVNASTWRIGNAALLLLLLYQPPALSTTQHNRK